MPQPNLYLENTLINKLKSLKQEHQMSNKACRHCILYHRKSTLLMNIFLGDLYRYCESEYLQDLIDINFAAPKHHELPGLSIRVKHSMSMKVDEHPHIMLTLPFFAITKDVGFFKNNTLIHCTPSLLSTDEKIKAFRRSGAQPETIITLLPSYRVGSDFGKHLDEKFWRYFLKMEKNIVPSYNNVNDESFIEESACEPSFMSHTYNTIRSDKPFATLRRGQTKDTDSEIFLLLFRKQYRNKDLLKVFDIQGDKKKFSNVFMIRIKEINIKFNSLDSLVNVSSVYFSFKYIAKILEVMEKKFQNQQQQQQANQKRVSSVLSLSTLPQAQKKKSPRVYYNFQDLYDTLHSEKIQIIIHRIKAQADIKSPNNIWDIELKNCMFENFGHLSNKLSFNSDDLYNSEDGATLFSIKSISFSTTLNFQGIINDVTLKYYEKVRVFDFSISTIKYRSVEDILCSIIEIPRREDSTAGKKALQVEYIFEDNLLSKVKVSAAPIKMSMSRADLSSELSSIFLFGTLVSAEGKDLPKLLENLSFERFAFEKAYSELTQHKASPKPDFDEPQEIVNKFTSILTTDNFIFNVIAERISIDCLKNDTVTIFSNNF